jgi:hypothetical protein
LVESLEDQSSPAKFADSLSIFLQSHLATVVDYAEKYGVNIPLNEDDAAIAQAPSSAQQEEHDSLAALLQSATSHLTQADGDRDQAKGLLSNGTITNGVTEQLGSVEDDGLDLKKLIEESLSTHLPELKEPSGDQPAPSGPPDFDSKNLASLISEKLKSDLDIPTHGLPNLSAPAATTNSQFATPGNNVHPAYQAYIQGSAPTPSTGAGGEVLPPNQSMPTAALYERARQAAVAKSSNTTRREGLHSTRRPWTPEEEKALMAGLDMVKGPHWSQILSLFGQHGTISDILKDRTQVQLKDKARNLKLFFLKTNSEMPYYLQSVTGELKTRAPGQAARKEAEEKARMNLEEEQARIQGIMTLAGGLQNNHHPVANPPLAASPSKRTSPATPGYGGAGATTTAAHMATGNGTAMPIPPRIKTEPSDQHLPKVTAFPPIQPAPAPGTTMQQARTPLPALQPQPGLHQQPRQPTQQQFQQPQQTQHPRPQEAQKVSMPLPQQQPRQPLQQHPPQAQQPQPQPQAQPRPPSQGQPQQQPQLQQHWPPSSQTPAQAQPQTVPRPSAMSQPQTAPSHLQQHQPQPSPQTQTQTQTQTQQTQQQPHAPVPSSAPIPQPAPAPPAQAPAPAQPQPLATPPIPPNHHSTPDHAQDTKLFETLQAAIAASTAGEGGQGQMTGHGHLATGSTGAATGPTATAAAVSEGLN